MDLFWQDFRQSVRSLSKARLHTALVLSLITLTVSLTVAVFAFFDAALLHPLPYPEPERLVVVSESHPQRGPGGPLRPANFLDWKSRNRCFAGATRVSSEACSTASRPATRSRMRRPPSCFSPLPSPPATFPHVARAASSLGMRSDRIRWVTVDGKSGWTDNMTSGSLGP